jgi:hypothetical protein
LIEQGENLKYIQSQAGHARSMHPDRVCTHYESGKSKGCGQAGKYHFLRQIAAKHCQKVKKGLTHLGNIGLFWKNEMRRARFRRSFSNK